MYGNRDDPSKYRALRSTLIFCKANLIRRYGSNTRVRDMNKYVSVSASIRYSIPSLRNARTVRRISSCTLTKWLWIDLFVSPLLSLLTHVEWLIDEFEISRIAI